MKIILIALSTFIIINVYSQDPIDESKCSECNIPCMCQLYYNNYLEDSVKRQTIVRNWNDFFGEDLSSFHEYPSGANVVNIKFDGLGCIYPENNPELLNIKSKILGNTDKDYRNFSKNSFYDLFNEEYHGKSDDTINAFIKAEAFPDKFCKIKRANCLKIIPNWQYDIDYFDFIKTWNAKHVPVKIEEINNQIDSKNYKKIIFFIHGYNVPYSLAVFQSKIILDRILIANSNLKAEDILLINVLWPSGSQKESKFDSADACDYSNFESPKTALAYTYYSNRAYLSAIYLRRIIREMETDLPIDIITHSHGSTVATSTLMNTTTKLEAGDLSSKIGELMNKEPLPDKEINVFLNAPSIPGVSTFIDLTDCKKQLKYRFFIGYNTNDEVLKKQKFKLFGKKIKSIAPTGKLSATTLGCNRNEEIEKTICMLKKKDLQHLFKAAPTSTLSEHDFFCYVKQEEFMKNLSIFLNGGFR